MAYTFAVYGRTGQLARALKRHMVMQGHRAVFFDRSVCDLSDSHNLISSSLDTIQKPDLVIIAAAYTAVDKAEEETDKSFAVNGAAPTIIANECARLSIPVVHISTDYVFPGQKSLPYQTDDPVGPINTYGASKLRGEIGVQKSEAKHAIIRTSWVFDGTGANFMTTMLRLAQTKESLSIVSDQYGRPT